MSKCEYSPFQGYAAFVCVGMQGQNNCERSGAAAAAYPERLPNWACDNISSSTSTDVGVGYHRKFVILKKCGLSKSL